MNHPTAIFKRQESIEGRRPNARGSSSFLVSKEGQQKIADLDNVVVRKDVEPKITWIVRNCASSIRRRQPDRLLHGSDK